MRLRGLPGALVLGLLASLAAHAAAFGGGHAQAGAFHDAYYGLAALGLVAVAAGYVVCAALGSKRCRDGSILAARLAPCVPGRAALTLSAVGWFALGEALDAAHSPGSLALTAFALVAAVVLVRALALALLRALAAIAIAIRGDERFAPRRPLRADRVRRPAPRRRLGIIRRVFTRPPPMRAIVTT